MTTAINPEVSEPKVPGWSRFIGMPLADSKFDLNARTLKLMEQETFLGVISRKTTKVKTNTIPTAAVLFNKNTLSFEMLYNPHFMDHLSEQHQGGVLKHEFYHIIMEHVSGRFKPTSRPEMIAWNHATDLAINSFLDAELPGECLVPGREPYRHLPKFMMAEWYYAQVVDEIKQKCAAAEAIAGAAGQFDDHEGWGDQEGTDGESQMAREVIKEMISQAHQEVRRSGGWGSVPEHMQKAIGSYLNGIYSVPWEEITRAFVRASRRADKHSTMRRLNKRYPRIHSGIRVRRRASILIAADESGSMSDEKLQHCVEVVTPLSDIADFTFAPFDADVDDGDVVEIKKGTKISLVRCKQGGTSFNAILNWMERHPGKKYDAIIMVTDGYAAQPRTPPPGIARMWLIPESDQPLAWATNEMVLRI